MEYTLKPEEKILLEILSDIFNGKALPDNFNADWSLVFETASKHRILPLLHDILQNQELSSAQRSELQNITKALALRNYRLFFLTKYFLNIFKDAGIPVVVIKGVSVSRLYPVPEYRQSGDVDLLLLDESKLDESCKILNDLGLTPAESEALHHLCWKTPDNIELEFHTMMMNPGKNEEFNRCYKEQLARLNGQYVLRDVFGCPLEVLPDGYQAYELLLHMLHHFIREGFGLRLLCDWVVFWNRPVAKKDIDQYLSLIHEIHLENFSNTICSVCHEFLGMSGNPEGIYVKDGKFVYSGGDFCDILPDSEAELFLQDILDGGDFGKSSSDRLVTMSSTGIKGYISEFHYAMRRKFPRAGKCFITWPVLWIAELFIFIHENQQNDRSGIDVIKKSSKRSQMIDELNLFR